MGCCSSASAAQSSKREWKPLEDRSCTDIPWLLLFVLFCIGMGFICGFSVATGAAARLVSGYDSYGNICGQKNAKLEAIPNSGMDHTHQKSHPNSRKEDYARLWTLKAGRTEVSYSLCTLCRIPSPENTMFSLSPEFEHQQLLNKDIFNCNKERKKEKSKGEHF